MVIVRIDSHSWGLTLNLCYSESDLYKFVQILKTVHERKSDIWVSKILNKIMGKKYTKQRATVR